MIILERLVSGTPIDSESINYLLAQQSPGTTERGICEREFQEVLSNPLFVVIVARDTDDPSKGYVGMATLFFQRNLARWIAETHDVVVDEAYRGRGIGESLIRKLMEVAREFARTREIVLKIFLTSRPSRVAANKLYAKLGFVLVAQAQGLWGTNLYEIIVR